MERKSFEEGIILALVSPPIPHVVRKQPIAYSYNGVILPALPEWDRERYPYAVIWQDMDYNVVVSVSIEPVVYKLYRGYIYENDPTNRLVYVIRDGKFVLDVDYDKEWNSDTATAYWANHDVLGVDNGSVYLAASEPIPYSGKLQYYLYNGTKMIALPEQYKETHPYALLHNDTDLNRLCLHFTKTPFRLSDEAGNGNYTLSYGSGADPRVYVCNETMWVYRSVSLKHIDASEYIWSNHDIIDPDGLAGVAGSVYREGSEPIPIYE